MGEIKYEHSECSNRLEGIVISHAASRDTTKVVRLKYDFLGFSKREEVFGPAVSLHWW
jgi:hypothetical protein